MAYPCNFKRAAVKAYKFIPSLRQLSNIFSVSISTLSRWNNASRRGTSLSSKNRSSKVSESLVAFIKQSLKNNPFVTQSALKYMIRDVFEFSVSESLVGTCIRRSGFSKKKTRSKPCRGMKPQNVEEFLSKFTEARRSHKRIVSIDETGFDDTSLPLMGYSPKGSHLVVKHPRTSRKRTSAVAAVCTSGSSNFSLSDNPINGNTFHSFLSSLDLPGGSVLLMDNIAFHKTRKVRDLANSRGWQMLFTPAYSPCFNPIENVFSVAKNAFRKANAHDVSKGIASSATARNTAIQNAFETVTPPLISACFKHVDGVCFIEHSKMREA